jgi:exodeoxyribonuclease V alpha subunit
MSQILQPLFSLLNELEQRSELALFDIQFTQWLAKKLPHAQPAQLFLSALTSHDLAQGHVCIDLTSLEARLGSWPGEIALQARQILSGCELLVAVQQLANTPLLIDNIIIGDGSVITPLVLDQQRLYLYRYWQYECKVAARLAAKTATDVNSQTSDDLKKQLDRFFSDTQQPDWQRIAAAVTTRNNITIISGGPGTGKTTTVTKLLAIHIENQLLMGKKTRIELAAPTGKAAARLSESIAGAKAKLNLSEQVVSLIPEQGKTIHRLLGVRGRSKKFIHDTNNPLLADLLVIDEASMIDLPMMASIVDALSKHTRLVLIGDRDQLASVEAGSVLGDMCDSPEQHCYSAELSSHLAQSCGYKNARQSQYAFCDNLAFLKKSYRFSDDSGIGLLAHACNSANAEEAESILNRGFPDLDYIAASEDPQSLLASVLAGYAAYVDIMNEQTSAELMLKVFNQFRVLCTLRVGSFGVESINAEIEKHFESTAKKSAANRWYIGRPIMITQNDNQMGLYNGDIGVACIDKHSGQLRVWFEQGNEVRAVLPSRLPRHETVFAMTVHKSQGSEFDHVMFVLAHGAKIINKELVYTAVTRAKQKFSYLGSMPLLRQAICTSTKRVSGLAQRIWQRQD